MLSVHDFTARMLGLRESQFVGLRAITEPDWAKRRNNPYAKTVLQVSRANGGINWRYAAAVNRQRGREGKPVDFRSDARAWGNPVALSPLVVHLMDTAEFYLEMKRERVERWYFDIETLKQVPEAEVLPYLRRRKPSRQNLDREVTLRDYRLDHIAEITIKGETWKIDPCWWKLMALRSIWQPPAATPEQVPDPTAPQKQRKTPAKKK